MGYKTDSITYELEMKAFNLDHGIRLLADEMIVGDVLASARVSPNVMDLAEVTAGGR